MIGLGLVTLWLALLLGWGWRLRGALRALWCEPCLSRPVLIFESDDWAPAPPTQQAALSRLIDFLKTECITGVFLSLTASGNAEASTDVGVSSLMDVWILLRNLESNGERNRGLYVLKARGMAHSNQIREFHISARGVELLDAYLGNEGVLMGTARAAQEAKEKAEALLRTQEIESKQREINRKRKALEAQIEALRAHYEAESSESEKLIRHAQMRETTLQTMQQDMKIRRQNEAPGKTALTAADKTGKRRAK